MRIVSRVTTAAVAIALATGTAKAEFQLSGPAASPVPPSAATLGPTEEPATAPPAFNPPQPRIARGFGDHVPLSFAVRQVVPQGVKASFAAGVDADGLLVDWRGGRPWPDVLRSLLRPANLQVTFRPGSVRIERRKPS